MAFTQAQLDNLEAAIAAGVTSVESPDGSTVRYRSMVDMLRLRDAMRNEIAGTTNTGGISRRVADFSDSE